MRKMFMATFILCAIITQAQTSKVIKPDYQTAIGAKIYPLALSFKTMTGKQSAIELLGYLKNGFRATALFEHYGNLNVEGNFKWYIGAGAHLGFVKNSKTVQFGADGVLGLDYKLLKAPLNISLDWQPSLGIGDDNKFIGDWGGLGIRYCF